jgi:hypothetical protein
MSKSSLEKLKITPMLLKEKRLERQTPIQVLFNPESYTINKSVSWNPLGTTQEKGKKNVTSSQFNAPIVEFDGGGSRDLTLKLFFDVTVPLLRNGRPVVIEDVRLLSDQIVALTRIHENQSKPAPPVCEISWGKALKSSDFPFIGVITSLNQEFTQFSRKGKPVRAMLTATFLEFFDPEVDLRKPKPALTTKVTHGGVSLGSMAADVFHNPKHWRIIAEANKIDNPRRLEVGKRLIIPKTEQ